MNDKEFKRIYGKAARSRMNEDSRRPWEDAFREIKDKFEGKTLGLYYDIFLDEDKVQMSYGNSAESAKYSLTNVDEGSLEFADDSGTKMTVNVDGSHKVNIYDTDRVGFKLSGGSVHIYFFET